MADMDDDELPPELQRTLLLAHASGDLPGPPPGLLAAVLARAMTHQGSAGAWKPFAPGVDALALSSDGEVRTWIARMEAGASLPPHGHERDEECFVIEGSVMLDDDLLVAGDEQCARAGTRHDRVFSPQGCLLLVRSAA